MARNEEAPPGKDIGAQLAFVGGAAQGVASGVLQQHVQQFARVKYCALLTGTRNDRVRAAKVTFVTQAERIKAMAADDSILEGRALRVRAWECRPKAQTAQRGAQRNKAQGRISAGTQYSCSSGTRRLHTEYGGRRRIRERRSGRQNGDDGDHSTSVDASWRTMHSNPRGRGVHDRQIRRKGRTEAGI